MRVLVTGADGFIGRALCKTLIQSGHHVRRAVRTGVSLDGAGYSRGQGVSASLARDNLGMAETIAVGAIGPETDWTLALADIEAVVHLAARVHVLYDKVRDPLTEFRQVNVFGSARLAETAAAVGVRRLVYVSSIKVNGESTLGQVFTEADVPAPQDAYGQSKLEAEQVLHRISEKTCLELVIVRPPLVYGPGVGANFLRMMNWINRGFPLPFASVHNLRSLIYLGNLVDALISCLMHPRAAGEIFLVSDGEDVSTPELIRRLAQAMGRSPRLVSFPLALLRLAGSLSGNSAELGRLLASLRIDSSRIRRELRWNPPFSMDQGLQETAAWYWMAASHQRMHGF
jgi:nucleoside-diphosphate-sugar epimerase